MKRILLGLIAVLLATVMLSGCFWRERGGDERGRGDEHHDRGDRGGGDRGDYDHDRH